MKTIQLLLSLLLVVASVNANALYEHDPVKREMVDNLRDRMGELKTGIIYGNVLNKARGAEDRLYKADDKLISMQKDEAASSHHGFRALLDVAASRFFDADEDDDDEEF